jgi:3-methyl-2-oxobutanoate hydroxymethyltransferase
VKQYADLRGALTTAVLQFRGEVADRSYPGPEHSYE